MFLSDVPRHDSRSHLATATAGLLPNVNAPAGKGCEEKNVDRPLGTLSAKFVILFDQLWK